MTRSFEVLVSINIILHLLLIAHTLASSTGVLDKLYIGKVIQVLLEGRLLMVSL